MKLLLKRHPPTGIDLTSEQLESHPAIDQVDVGELVINTFTGKLYTKLDSGNLVVFSSQAICFDPQLEVSFFYENAIIPEPEYLFNNFCCAGGLLTVVVDKLKPEPFEYRFYLSELTSNFNPQDIKIDIPSYISYSDSDITYRKATVPISLSLNSANYDKISLFQFRVTDNNNKIIKGSQRTVTIKCLESNN